MSEKIAVIGSSFVDCKSYLQEEYNPQGRNYGTVEVVHGGIGRNIAVNMADLEFNVSFISTIDNSSFGHDFLEKLNKKNINTEHILPINDKGMGFWMAIVNPDGLLQTSVTQLPDIKHLETYIDKYAEKFARLYQTVLLELDLSEKITSKMINACKKNKRSLFVYSANAEFAITDDSLLQDLACFVINEEVASKMFDEDVADIEVHIVQKRLKEFVQNHNIQRGIVTLSQRGSVFYDNLHNQSGYIEPFEVTVVDTSGAGEALFSATAAGLLQGVILKDAIAIGAEYAGIAIAQASNNPREKEGKEKVKQKIREKIKSETDQ